MSHVVVTSAYGLEVFNWILPDVTTLALSLYLFQHVVLDVATSVFLSRHHVFKFCSFFGCLCCDPCCDLLQVPFYFPDVVTSELDCVDLKTASVSQLFASIFASIIDCIFIHLLLQFSSFFHFPANDSLVSFFIFLYSNCSIFR